MELSGLGFSDSNTQLAESKLWDTYVRVFRARSCKAQHSIDFHSMVTIFGAVRSSASSLDVAGRNREEE